MSFKEQIMPKDNYPSIFSPQMETILFIMLLLFLSKFRICDLQHAELGLIINCINQTKMYQNFVLLCIFFLYI